jgi:hypothetical protein
MRNLLLAASASLLAICATPALADHDLPPGDSGSPFAPANGPYILAPTGALLADTGLQNMSMTVGATTLNATFRSAVYDAGGGNLDFLYQVTNNGSSTTAIEELSFANFTGFTVLGAWQQLAAFGVFGAGVEEADSAERNAQGDALGAVFDTNLYTDVNAGANQLLNPGETSAIFQFRVTAPNFTVGTFTAQDGIAVTAMGFSPTLNVPEPATWGLMILGFGGVGALVRRSRRATQAVLA